MSARSMRRSMLAAAVVSAVCLFVAPTPPVIAAVCVCVYLGWRVVLGALVAK